ncbi:MAG: hypothetical protein ABFS08_05635 [Pseudomonadota bacterium]
MEITLEQEDKLKQATEDFRRAMGIRNAMNVRVATRVTAILRIGMVSFGVVTIILLLMLYAFTSKMDEMIVALNTMNKEFTSMSKDMTMMRTTLGGMERNISHVPAITKATRDISTTVGTMRTEVVSMDKTIANLNYEVDGITNQVGNMTWQIRSLDPAVQNIGVDVNRMSGPMRMFNIFSPFD